MDTNAPDSTVILDGENINLIPNSINNFGDSVFNNPNYEEIESEMMTSLNPTFEVETTTSDSIQATDQHGQNNKTEVADSLNKSSLEIVDSEEIITDILVETTVSNEESIHSKAEIIDNIQVVTDTFIILQEKPQYSSEIDSLKLLNEALRLRAKQSNSTVDTLVYSIFFSSGNQLLNYRNQETLADLVNDSQDKNYILQLSGHTDKSGSEQQNKILSEKRVNNVLKYLVKNGLDERKIFIQSFGEKFSTNNNDLNQRVVLCRLIIKKEFETH
jgi:outer membrane protein OmpA-like peptidoglycan-associated protein